MAVRSRFSRPTIGGELERMRIEHRLRRVDLALAELHRLSDPRTDGDSPPALRQAINRFTEEHGRLERRLADITTTTRPARPVRS
jgi:hypothetical protein